MRTIFLFAAMTASAPLSAQDADKQQPPPVYGPVFEEPSERISTDDSARYRINSDLDTCFQEHTSAPTLYEDEMGTRLSYRGSGVRLRVLWGDGNASEDRVPARCRNLQTPEFRVSEGGQKLAASNADPAILPK
ncbi:MAG: hypothetical protein AB7E85_05125 [Pseudobdellovibrionaceae bacterium]